MSVLLVIHQSERQEPFQTAVMVFYAVALPLHTALVSIVKRVGRH